MASVRLIALLILTLTNAAADTVLWIGADDPQLARRVPYRYPSGRAPSVPTSDVGSEAPPPPCFVVSTASASGLTPRAAEG